MTAEMRTLAEEHNIELFFLPPHTTHRTQPLDVGIFGPLQRHWMEQCDAVLEDTGEEIQKLDFNKEYMAAQKLAFLPETIMKAWARCGICPLNPKIFSDADFVSSTSTSTKGHVPTSYPAEFYGKESDLDRDENEDEDAHGGDMCNEDRELDDNDDDGSNSYT
jgi:hypothetical protein